MSLIVFFMINFVGDPVDMLVNPESLPEEIERVRRFWFRSASACSILEILTSAN